MRVVVLQPHIVNQAERVDALGETRPGQRYEQQEHDQANPLNEDHHKRIRHLDILGQARVDLRGCQLAATNSVEAHVATFQDLSADNANLRSQYDEWREARSNNGEDPTDYQAFRQHVIELGAPDPGESEIDDFVGDEFKAEHPERYGAPA